MERKFAVVQWSEGEDSGKLSEVKTDTIRGYDDSKMDQHGNPISTYSAVIEWRHGKKPRGGWPHYRGTVVFVSATRFETTRKFKSLLKEDEPLELTKRVSVPPQKYQDDSDNSTDTETQILTQSLHVKKSKALTRKDPAEDFLEKYCHSEPTSDDRSPRKTIFVLKQEIKDLKEENAKLKEMVVQDVPEILRTMKNILDSAVPPKRSRLDLTTPPLPPQSSYSSSANSSPSLPRSTPPSSMSESVTPSLTDSRSSKVEIHPGTGVMVEKLAWTYALNANSATVFVRHLLTAVFPLEILLLSNLRGGKRGGGDARLPLDKKKLDAIYSATLERWPGTQLSSIGTTINGKITELRTKSKNVAVSTASS
ncbi:uncharacterized protein LOC133463926 [Cololabis saira]|uniref:uncharacterized protein LOC133463926 n=1 Tax=Cololabis saira TaxID=129043 RepID=UPI002AD31926|nr:uncharacterized protein LOC133463926 [Cololabis saira]